MENMNKAVPGRLPDTDRDLSEDIVHRDLFISIQDDSDAYRPNIKWKLEAETVQIIKIITGTELLLGETAQIVFNVLFETSEPYFEE